MATVDSSLTTVGRPRNPHAEQIIFDAVLELIGDGATLTSLSLVTIARHAGISRNSLYRRWRTKEELYLDVVNSTMHSVIDIPQYSARETIVKLLSENFDHAADEGRCRLDRVIYAEAENFPKLREWYDEEIAAPRRSLVRLAIRRGKESGEIRVDVNEDILTDALISLVFAGMFSEVMGDFDPDSLSRLITDLAFDGVAPK